MWAFRFLFCVVLITNQVLGEEISRANGPLPPLTLDAAISEGLRRSPEIQRSRAVVSEKSWRTFEAVGAGFLPKISVSGVHYFDTQYAITNINFGGTFFAFPGFYPNTQASIDISVPVFDGFANIRRLQAASLTEDASEKELSHAEFQLAEDVRLAFYQALGAAQIEDAAEENVKTLEDHLKQVKIQRQGGVATNYDSLRVEVQLNEARADAIDAKDNVTLTRKKLTLLLGLENDDRALQGELPVPAPSQVEHLELSGTADRSDIQALTLHAEASDKLGSAGAAWLFPTISLGGEYLLYDAQVFNNAIVNTGDYKSAYFAGIFLKWNLFDGGVSMAQANEAAYMAIQAEKASRAARLQVPYDFAYWKRRYISNSDHYLSKQLDINRSREAVRLAKEEERAGTRTSSETLDAELDLFRARAGVVNAQVSAAEALIKLEQALGRRI
jgi:outer membrane protein TolC